MIPPIDVDFRNIGAAFTKAPSDWDAGHGNPLTDLNDAVAEMGRMRIVDRRYRLEAAGRRHLELAK